MSHTDYEVINDTLDGIGLLRIVKLICFSIEDEKYPPLKSYETKQSFFTLKQGNDSTPIYYNKYANVVQVINQCGASLGEDHLTRRRALRTWLWLPNSWQ